MVVLLASSPLVASPAHGPLAAGVRDPLDPLYTRIAADLRAGRPLVITVHVALCDNRVIRCGSRALGDGDHPARNLYWGAGGGLRAYFDHQRPSYHRVLLDGGDGQSLLERVVYQHRVSRPSAAWRRRGVTRPFDVLLVGLAYRGTHIDRAMRTFIEQVAGAARGSSTLTLQGGRRVDIGAAGHVVGYAGHNHLMDVSGRFDFPPLRRREHLGFFALACHTESYLAGDLRGPPLHALLLTRSLMYPGAFTIDGLARGLWQGADQRAVFREGARYYARYQRRPERLIRRAFIHGADERLRRRQQAGTP